MSTTSQVEKKLSRKERRALEFGTPEAQQAIRMKLQGRFPFYFDIAAEVKMIPTIGMLEREDEFIMPYDRIPEAYRVSPPNVANLYAGTADTPEKMHVLLRVWFFKGLSEFDIHLREDVRLVTEDGKTDKASVLKALQAYTYRIMGSWAPAHEHKMAYVAYVLHSCASKILWTSSEK